MVACLTYSLSKNEIEYSYILANSIINAYFDLKESSGLKNVL
jgi:hypothetical protein